MANLYYNAAVDTAWDTRGNWWNDDIFTDPALALPTTGDTVYLYGYMTSGPTTPVTLNHIYAYTLSYGGQLSFTGAIGNATFQDSQNSGTVTGDATFNGSSYNFGTVTGNATFNDTSINYDGTVTGNATFNGTFNGTSYNRGEVAGDATFNDSSYNDVFGEVAGEATFNGTSYNGGILGYFNGMPTGIPVTFNDNSINNSVVVGDTTFNGSSHNAIGATVTGATFNGSSYNGGSVGGDATFNDFSFAQSGGSVAGDATFDLTAAATQIIGGYDVSFNGDVVVSGGSGGGNGLDLSQLLGLPNFIKI
jgi:hypothetical protein